MHPAWLLDTRFRRFVGPAHWSPWHDAQGVGGTRGFLPAVEGMRACAAIGVVVTHVAFQTGHTGGIAGRLFGRFDLAVAVFFALSGFLLWRGHAAAARGLRHIRRPGTTCGRAWSASCPRTWWRSW